METVQRREQLRTKDKIRKKTLTSGLNVRISFKWTPRKFNSAENNPLLKEQTDDESVIVNSEVKVALGGAGSSVTENSESDEKSTTGDQSKILGTTERSKNER